MNFKFGDFLIVFFFLFLAFSGFKVKNSNSNLKVEILTPFKKEIIDLTLNRKLRIKGENGFLVLEIKNKKVRVIKSTCRNKICIKTGWISKEGESIVCVPNRVIIKILGNSFQKKKRIDYITK